MEICRVGGKLNVHLYLLKNHRYQAKYTSIIGIQYSHAADSTIITMEIGKITVTGITPATTGSRIIDIVTLASF